MNPPPVDYKSQVIADDHLVDIWLDKFYKYPGVEDLHKRHLAGGISDEDYVLERTKLAAAFEAHEREA